MWNFWMKLTTFYFSTPMNNVLLPMTNDSFNSYQNFFIALIVDRGFADHISGTSDLVPRLPAGPILQLSICYITHSLLSWRVACHITLFP